MLERDFTIVCDRGCDLPPVYLERAQATVLESVPHDALGHADEVALKQEFIRLYRKLAALRPVEAHAHDLRLVEKPLMQVTGAVADDREVLLAHAGLPPSASSGRWSARGPGRR